MSRLAIASTKKLFNLFATSYLSEITLSFSIKMMSFGNVLFLPEKSGLILFQNVRLSLSMFIDYYSNSCCPFQ